jgi:hypothetical protein
MKLTGRRTQTGAELVEGSVGMIMVVSMMVIAVLFIFNVAILGNYQNKLDFVAMQAAQWAANNKDNTGKTGNDSSYAFVATAMEYTGLAPNNLKVTTSSKGSGTAVTISNSFALFGKASWLPSEVTLQDTEFALPDVRSTYKAYLRIPGFGGSSYDCYVPVVSVGASNYRTFLRDITSVIDSHWSKNATSQNNVPVYPEMSGWSYAQKGMLNGNWGAYFRP